ncbi:MAG: aminodeoxychorismate synthase component I [Magnetovibrio sp.]|nr:aminodeoxychorismate synthase component I [Magnetovibrio sp.]
MSNTSPLAQPPFVLIDDAQKPGGALLFTNPKEIITAHTPDDVTDALAHIDEAISGRRYVAGYLAYELGLVLESKLRPLLHDGLDAPLIWMGVFDEPHPVDDSLFKVWENDDYSVGELKHDLSRDDYMAQVERIRDHIRAGDVYQINHTFKQHFEFSGSPYALYAHLRKTQRAQYGALITTGDYHILSLSPELFVESQDGIMRTRPMKGTAPRQPSPIDDETERQWLCHDEKSRAENLMIVDLLRNDLGRIALVGSVNVSELFTVETYPTVHQMTSTIEAKLRPGTTFNHFVHALFPCGSVTGAPKVKAMELINNLEPTPRGVYTGAVGYSGPGGQHRYNVAIRTLRVENDRGELGIGSGIVYDSDPAAEWDECHVKARFLTHPHTEFDLLETILWEPLTGFAYLDLHLDRLQASAASFGYLFDRDVVMSNLNHAVEQTETPQRLRLLLNIDGKVSIETADLTPIGNNNTLTYSLSPKPIDPNNPFIYHKTTHRAFYDDERTRLHQQYGCDEVIFLNLDGELTEGSFTNLFIEQDGQTFTPPLRSGLLPGTLRSEWIRTKKATEKVLFAKDLTTCNQIWLGNSVRGMMKAIPIKS